LLFSPRAALVAEILFLRKQLALFQERKVKPRRTTPAFRIAMVVLARFFDWRDVLMIVKPETLVLWHRNAFRRFGHGSLANQGGHHCHWVFASCGPQ